MIVARVPGDKSISHRALILGTLAMAPSRLRGVLDAGDTRSTARALNTLGAAVPELGSAAELVIPGGGVRGWHEPAGELDCGNSGTTARLLLGALAGMPLRARLNGDASLCSRPLRRVTEPLGAMGARITEQGRAGRLPLVVEGGALRPLVHASPVSSAQVKGALLLAGITGGAAVAVTEPQRSRDHTERMLGAMGVSIVTDQVHDGICVRLLPTEALQPLDIDVPGDFSAAAFLIAAALCARTPITIERVGVNPTRTGMLAVLARMGVDVRCVPGADSGGEPVADLVVEPAELRATDIAAHEMPSLIDEIPVLAILAARAAGVSRIEGAGELRLKESDRIGGMVANLRALGAAAVERPDGLTITGSARPLAGRVTSAGDHRIAMAFGALGVAPDCDISIDAPATAGISFPGYWAQLAAFRPTAGAG